MLILIPTTRDLPHCFQQGPRQRRRRPGHDRRRHQHLTEQACRGRLRKGRQVLLSSSRVVYSGHVRNWAQGQELDPWRTASYLPETTCIILSTERLGWLTTKGSTGACGFNKPPVMRAPLVVIPLLCLFFSIYVCFVCLNPSLFEVYFSCQDGVFCSLYTFTCILSLCVCSSNNEVES